MLAPRRVVAVTLAILALVAVVMPLGRGSAPRAQGVDIFLNVTGGGTSKLNIFIPDFSVTAGTDPTGLGKQLATVTGADLNFTGRFTAVAGQATAPANDPAALKKLWADAVGAGAHAALHGLFAIHGDRIQGEMRLYDLTSAEQRMIASKTFTVPAGQPRRLAHKIADEVVLQFTGEPGIADTKLAYVDGRPGAKEIVISDYDGYGSTRVTQNGSINLTPTWSPDARSIAYTSYKGGYPDLYRMFPFERRPEQTLAAFSGINSSPAWSPDGRSLALTLSKDGNPEIYILALATGTLRRLTRHAAIDTEPTWSPTGREIAFVSNRAGLPHIFVMDAEGANVRQITSGGFQTQPRWSPRGDVIAYTMREGGHDIWLVGSDGSNAHRLTYGASEDESPTWSPNGRHVAFQSNRAGGWQLFAVLVDGTQVTQITRGGGERTSPSWSPRLP